MNRYHYEQLDGVNPGSKLQPALVNVGSMSYGVRVKWQAKLFHIRTTTQNLIYVFVINNDMKFIVIIIIIIIIIILWIMEDSY